MSSHRSLVFENTDTSGTSCFNSSQLEVLLASLRKVSSPFEALPPLWRSGPRSKLKTLHRIRKEVTANDTQKIYGWEHNYAIVTDAGHQWCSIIRDNHACFGHNYEKLLKMMRPFQAEKYGLQHFPWGSRVLAVGNSHLLELIYPVICAAGDRAHGFHMRGNSHIFILKDEGNKKADRNLKTSISHCKNGIGTSLLVFDNDPYFAGGKSSTSRTIDFLKNSSWMPTHIVVGYINGNKETCATKARIFRQAYPGARLLCRCYERGGNYADISSLCGADFSDCSGRAGHQCVPSRGVIRGAEELVREWFGELEPIDQCMDP